MARYWTSDTHFGHQRIIELADRPFSSVEEMNRELIDRWNDTVRPTDEVWHLGDVAMGTIAESLPLVKRLHGKKRLIIGNHDRVFADAPVRMRERFEPEYGALFELGVTAKAQVMIETGRGMQPVNVCHFPYDGDSQEKGRFTEHRLVDDGLPLLHGHTHAPTSCTLSRRGTPQLHVGVDSQDWRFTPVSEVYVTDWLNWLAEEDGAEYLSGIQERQQARTDKEAGR